jgi:hypothetical protein
MSTTLTTIRWLSIFTGALSLFYLGHAWFEFGLVDLFTRVYAWYAGILHPVVDLLKPLALSLAWLVGWSLPPWWKDAMVVYLALGGASSRGGLFPMWDAMIDAQDWRGLAKRDPSEANLRTLRGKEERLRRWESIALVLIPLRMVGWPLFWAWDLFVILPRRLGFWSSNEISVVDVRLSFKDFRHGNLATSLIEALKILVGVVIFAGLNAGLG